MYKFNFKKHICGNIIYAILNVSLIHVVLTPFMRAQGCTPLQISTLHSSLNIAWFVCLYISGVLFDRYGARITLLLGRIVDLISIILLLKPTYNNMLTSMILAGIANGITYGKYTSFMYNSLSLEGKLNKYPCVASIYYCAWDIGISAMSFASSLILKHHTYEVVIQASVVLKILAIIFIFVYIPSNKNSRMHEFKSESIKIIFSTLSQCIKGNKVFVYLLLFYGMLNFFTYPIGITIGGMIFMDNGFTAENIALYTSVFTIFMAIGTVIPIFIFPNGISVKKCISLSLIQMIMLFFSALLYNIWAFMVATIFINVTFSLVEVSIERRFEDYSNKKIRGTAVSMAISLSNILEVVNVMIIGFIAQHYSYHAGLIAVVAPLVVAMFFFFKVLRI